MIPVSSHKTFVMEYMTQADRLESWSAQGQEEPNLMATTCEDKIAIVVRISQSGTSGI